MSLRLFFQAEDGIRDLYVTGVQTCALPISANVVGALGVNLLGSVSLQPARPVPGTLRECTPRGATATDRSEERRVGKECRSPRSPEHSLCLNSAELRDGVDCPCVRVSTTSA